MSLIQQESIRRQFGRKFALRMQPMLAISCILPAIALTGCGRSGYPKLATVTGLVTLDNEPVADAYVTFAPLNGRSSSGRTDMTGKYSLSYKKDMPGAVLGKHLVKITKLVEDDSPAAKSYAEKMNARQRALDEQNGFVPDEDSNYDSGVAAIDRPQLNLIPDRYGGPNSELSVTVGPDANTFDFQLTSSEEAQP